MHAEGFDPPQTELESQSAAAFAAEQAYYLDDFNCVIRGVAQRYAGLLNAEELEYIGRLKTLSRPAQMLYVRLVNRKGPFFRAKLLDYPEIGRLDAPIAELADAGLLQICVALPPASRQRRLLACFTLPELVKSLKPHAAPKSGRAGLLEWLTAWESFESWLESVLAEHEVVGLTETDPWPFLRFLFFGELRDNLADFVTRALGHIVTERFDEAALQPYFLSRAQADDAYRMALLYQAFGEIRDARPAIEVLEWWRGHAIERDRLVDGLRWFDRLVDRLGYRLERARETEAALALYATSPMAPARERRARLLIKAGRKDDAVALLQEIAAAPCHPEEAYRARQLLARLQKKTRRTEAHQFQLESRTITVHYAPRFSGGEPGMTVEAAVLEYYREQGWQGVHAENWLWNASFGLLLWDIIYNPALGVFHSPLQFAPSDIYSPEFYSRRQKAIETRLALLQQPARAFEIVTRNFAGKQGIANPFVGWHDDLPEILGVMLHRVPATGHAAVLRHMARNLRHHAHGFLDLFIWNERDYRFIEIKSENDKLAGHQFEWLRFFAEAGINVSLEKVQREKVQREKVQRPVRVATDKVAASK